MASESLEHTLGAPIDSIHYFQPLRALRHRGLYEGATHIPESQVAEVLREVSDLYTQLATWLAERESG